MLCYQELFQSEHGVRNLDVAAHAVSRTKDPYYLAWKWCCFRHARQRASAWHSVRDIASAVVNSVLGTFVARYVLFPQTSNAALSGTATALVALCLLLGQLLWVGRTQQHNRGPRYWFTHLTRRYNACYDRAQPQSRCARYGMRALKLVLGAITVAGVALGVLLATTAADLDSDEGRTSTDGALVAWLVVTVAVALCLVLPSHNWTNVLAPCSRALGCDQPEEWEEGEVEEGREREECVDEARLRAVRQDVKGLVLVVGVTLCVTVPLSWVVCVGEGCSYTPQLALALVALVLFVALWRLFNLMHRQSWLVWRPTTDPVAKATYRILQSAVVGLFVAAIVLFALGSAIKGELFVDERLATVASPKPAKTAYSVRWGKVCVVWRHCTSLILLCC